MKIAATKKTIIILGLCFFVLLGMSLFLIFRNKETISEEDPNPVEKDDVLKAKDEIYERDNYYFVDVGFDEKEYPYVTYIKGMTLENIDIVEDEIKLSFNGEIKGKPVILALDEKNFILTTVKEDIEEDFDISPSDYSILEIGKTYVLTFLSIPKTAERLMPEILTNCKLSQSNPWLETLCQAGEERIRESVIDDREKYLNDLIDDSGPNINPDRFIPYVLLY